MGFTADRHLDIEIASLSRYLRNVARQRDRVAVLLAGQRRLLRLLLSLPLVSEYTMEYEGSHHCC